MIVLDTDVISDLMRRTPRPELLARLADIPVSDQYTTAITIGELAHGAQRVNRPELYQRALALLHGVVILAFDKAAAERYGTVRSELERQGQKLADPDLRIAATVMAHGATLITGNVRHFERIAGLGLADWLRG